MKIIARDEAPRGQVTAHQLIWRTHRADRGWPALLGGFCVLLVLTLPGMAVAGLSEIEITKEPNSQTVVEGGSASFTITVTNPSTTETLTGVSIEDPQTLACAQSLRDLPPLASEVVVCSTAALLTGFTNTATAKADGGIEASDDATVVVVTPTITITKEPDFQQVASGATATFTITVFSPTCDDLSEVNIVDPETLDCERSDEFIACEDDLTYDCTTDALFADLTNVATVTAVAGRGEVSGLPVEDSDTAFVEVLGPGIQITKGPGTQQVVVGGKATFDVVVRNSGQLSLTDIVITDLLTTDCELSLAGPLAPSERIDYSCETDALSDGFINEIEVTADSAGGTVEGSDTAEVVVVEPSIEITKVADSSQVLAGEAVEFTITIRNLTPVVPLAPVPPPSATLTEIDVIDLATPDCSRPFFPETPAASLGDLAPGEMHTYTCTTDPLGDDLTNVITVTAKTDSQVPVEVSSQATAFVDVVDEIDLMKEPSEQAVPYGDTASFTITVSNPNDVTLSVVSIDDPLSPDCDRANVGPLGPGASAAPYDCTSSPVTADFVNVATAMGDGGLTGSDGALVRVVLPSIEVTKEPAGQSVVPGGQASFAITVTNPGPGDLAGVVVSDPQSPDCDRNIGALASGASFGPYNCQSGALFADLTNKATVDATSAAGPVSAEAEAFVNVLNPIGITKKPDSQTVLMGGNATFEITVTNKGTDDLTGVTVVDDTTPACSSASIGTLPADGGPFVYSCEASGVDAAFTNTATARATAPSGPVEASDSAEVRIAASGMCAETPTGTGTGLAEICLSGGGPDCSFDSFFGLTTGGISPPPPAGVVFPHGILGFNTLDCVPGSTVEFTLTLPSALPPGSEYYKFGPSVASPGVDSWYTIPSSIVGNVVTFSITDGGLGDHDKMADGGIRDPGGPGAPAAVPALPAAALAAMALALALLGVLALRRRGADQRR